MNKKKSLNIPAQKLGITKNYPYINKKREI